MSGRRGAGPAVVIRDAAPADLPIIRSIHAYRVLHGLASFEEVPPDAAEIERRYRDILARGLPYVVAECDARVAGFDFPTADAAGGPIPQEKRAVTSTAQVLGGNARGA